jgi:hypothetical protein
MFVTSSSDNTSGPKPGITRSGQSRLDIAARLGKRLPFGGIMTGGDEGSLIYATGSALSIAPFKSGGFSFLYHANRANATNVFWLIAQSLRNPGECHRRFLPQKHRTKTIDHRLPRVDPQSVLPQASPKGHAPS